MCFSKETFLVVGGILSRYTKLQYITVYVLILIAVCLGSCVCLHVIRMDCF